MTCWGCQTCCSTNTAGEQSGRCVIEMTFAVNVYNAVLNKKIHARKRFILD